MLLIRAMTNHFSTAEPCQVDKGVRLGHRRHVDRPMERSKLTWKKHVTPSSLSLSLRSVNRRNRQSQPASARINCAVMLHQREKRGATPVPQVTDDDVFSADIGEFLNPKAYARLFAPLFSGGHPHLSHLNVIGASQSSGNGELPAERRLWEELAKMRPEREERNGDRCSI